MNFATLSCSGATLGPLLAALGALLAALGSLVAALGLLFVALGPSLGRSLGLSFLYNLVRRPLEGQREIEKERKRVYVCTCEGFVPVRETYRYHVGSLCLFKTTL